MEKVTEEFAAGCFKTGIDCSQIVFGHCAGKLGLDEKQAMRISSPFGGGMWHAETCGCVIGALMAIGLKHGNDEANQPDIKQNMLAKKVEFETRFKEKNKSLICREILGYDLSKEEEMKIIMDKGLLFSVCPRVVVSACEILDEVL
ncbi:MAG: C-GCAxxG-C-C family protein [Prolixibacteraceae bacterium]|jgi:C_GCAxxG_C_C family probable redox protein|nr:C-GCAxxG-C-C family protein [Bacteroidota bacterium]NLS98979.1 C_GCAxxG_C_C family protein [Bacteroidales bacterium]OQB81535.1 MAG: putative redox-active protein (C_GCAxxG_C_C) [Bacteroidetes bacterium ADurb.Bin123]HNZ68853.1 C-GCAxxG-C-C family protein [Prolixibacteraceae bacterium]HOC86448.1 C-GCAxxG-C-C family protein [Prolixibacteraceae bacterium]